MKYVRTWRIAGQGLKEYLVSKKEMRKLSKTAPGDPPPEGLCRILQSKFYVRDDISLTRRPEVEIHEIAHYFLDVTGLSTFFADTVTGDLDKWEEQVIRIMSPHLHVFIQNITEDVT